MVVYEIEGHKQEPNLRLAMEFSGKDVMITATDTDDMLSKLSHILNTFAMMIVVIGLLSVVVG